MTTVCLKLSDVIESAAVPLSCLAHPNHNLMGAVWETTPGTILGHLGNY